MSDESAVQVAKPGVSPLMVVIGLAVIVLWLGGAFVLGAFKLMASVMANDSGAASESKHLTLIFGMMGGQVLTGLAGIPAGLAFFWRTRRKGLLWAFSILLLTGLLVQAASFFSFLP